MKERLQKLMAHAGVDSRRACEDLIRAGRVRVNGAIATIGDQADPATDVIEVDGRRLNVDQEQRTYIALYKPINVVSSNVRQHRDKRQTIRELVPVEGHLFTIGRLDAESEGLIVLTNDGDLVNRLTHPRYQHTKTYKVIVYGLPTAEAIREWERGVDLGEDGVTAPCWVEVVKGGKISTLRIVMTEGKKRQIRRVSAQLGYPVKRLIRTHIGQLALGTLKPGEWRELSERDVKALETPTSEQKRLRQQKVRRPRSGSQRSSSPPPRPKGTRRNNKR